MTARNNIENQNPDLWNRFTLGKQFYNLEGARREKDRTCVCVYIYVYIRGKGRELAKGKGREEKKRKKNGEIRRERVSTGHHISGVGLSQVYKEGREKKGVKREKEGSKKEKRNDRRKLILYRI